ncbi:MAG: hypothetical protein EBX36_11355 [Planctomycetia bacterium]|nr:hypothetical protein [Planctomycetia bacterium]
MENAPQARPSFTLLCAAWFALVAVAAIGRLWQPAVNVTPLAAAAIAAGGVFANPLVAATVPLAALAVSNLVLPGYGLGGGIAMALVVHAAFAWPVLLGGCVAAIRGEGRRWPAVVGSALASSLVFFVVTNFAHWCLTDDYPHTSAGLLSCYAAGLPFYRWMPVGDVVWSLAMVGGLAACGVLGSARRPVSSLPAKAA